MGGAMEGKPTFRKVLQVGVVVRDLDRSVRQYEGLGIGPWEVFTLGPSNMRDLRVRGQRVDFSMRVAFAKIGDFQWELIQPLDERSIYFEFLREHGEGLHHVAFHVDDFGRAVEFFRDKGVGVLQSGEAPGLGFAYLDTKERLSFVAEIYNLPNGTGDT